MIWGLSTAAFTQLHVVISLIGIGSGLLVAFGLIKGKRFDGATAIFLLATILTSVTGFAFPNEHITPGIVVGVLSCIVLALALVGRYGFKMAGVWRGVYVISAMLALFFNCFVLIVQLFEKVPALHALAPHGKEPPFAVAQLLLLVIFIVLTALGVKKFRPA